MRLPCSLLLLAVGISAISPHAGASVAGTARAPALVRRRRWAAAVSRCQAVQLSSKEVDDLQAELSDSDEASADSGPKILMPPVESLGLMPDSEATSFTGYLAPYAALVLLAFALASGAFALLVLKG